jgi:hypothetical protein
MVYVLQELREKPQFIIPFLPVIIHSMLVFQGEVINLCYNDFSGKFIIISLKNTITGHSQLQYLNVCAGRLKEQVVVLLQGVIRVLLTIFISKEISPCFVYSMSGNGVPNITCFSA